MRATPGFVIHLGLAAACTVDAASDDASAFTATETETAADGSTTASTGSATGASATAAGATATGATSIDTAADDASDSTDDDGHGDSTGGTPDDGALPAKLVAGYWQMWQGPRVAEITANAPEYNLQYAAFALGTEPGTGHVSFDPVYSPPDELRLDIAASRAAGSRWLLSIGGGGEGAITLLEATHADQMVASLIPIIDDYGFDGIDFDLESGPDGWSVDAMAAVAQQLDAHYGPQFIISAAPRPYEDEYRDAALAMGDTLDLFGFQFYDAPEFNDPQFLHDNIVYRVNQAIDLGIPASKIMIGCITYSDYGYGHNTVEVYRDIFLELEQDHPDLRGVFIWETSLDALEGWSFAHGMGAALLP